MIDASTKAARSPQALKANLFQWLGGTSKQAAENADWARNAPTIAEARIDFGRLMRRRSAALPGDRRVTERSSQLS